MPFSRFRSIRTRLAAIAAAAAAPMALIIGFNAFLTSATVRNALESVPESTATALRQTIQTTLVGAARVALTAAEAAQGQTEADCSAFLGRVLALNGGYAAIRIDRPQGTCFAVREADRERVGAIGATFDRTSLIEPTASPPTFAGQVLIGAAIGDGLRATFVRARRGEGAQATTAWIMIGPDLLRRALAAVDTLAPGDIALVDGDGGAIVTGDISRNGWLPAARLADLTGGATHLLPSRDGKFRRYAVFPLAAENIFVIAAMDSAAAQNLSWQLSIALLVPLATLLLIAVAYSRTMKSAVIRWIEAMDDVARRSAVDPNARALVSPRMPQELATVAESFNDMLTKRQARESALAATVAHNQYLARELHHRVKNSLQMVQSYLALELRAAAPQARAQLIGAQARTYILAAAYRRALDQHEMVAFEVDPFLSDVADFAASMVRADGKTVTWSFQTGVAAGIDEAIPLGMVVAELIEAGVVSGAARDVHVAFRREGELTVIEARSSDAAMRPASRLFQGLMRQLGATRTADSSGGFRAVFKPSPISASTLLPRG